MLTVQYDSNHIDQRELYDEHNNVSNTFSVAGLKLGCATNTPLVAVATLSDSPLAIL